MALYRRSQRFSVCFRGATLFPSRQRYRIGDHRGLGDDVATKCGEIWGRRGRAIIGVIIAVGEQEAMYIGSTRCDVSSRIYQHQNMVVNARLA